MSLVRGTRTRGSRQFGNSGSNRWTERAFHQRNPFGLGPIYMPFLCSMTPAHLDFLCRNEEKFRQQVGSPVKLTPPRRPADEINCGNPRKE
jgi:hypothetical protein